MTASVKTAYSGSAHGFLLKKRSAHGFKKTAYSGNVYSFLLKKRLLFLETSM